MRILVLIATVLVAGLFLSNSAFALSLGDNITISDENYSGTGWYGNHEDQEVEPGMQHTQQWDLEGFFLQENTLNMVGGFNFKDGCEGYTSGDIFISVDDKPIYGDIHLTGNNDVYSSYNGNKLVTNSYGYDYVIDLNFISGTYNVISIDSDTVLQKSFYQLNEGSSPWKYNNQNNNGKIIGGGSFSFLKNLSNGDVGFLGDSHYALTGFDLSFLDPGTEFYSHFTMGCGNDNLMGQGSTAPVPEPSTLVLFGAGGGLFWLAGRKMTRKA